jgi:hypothetical protein
MDVDKICHPKRVRMRVRSALGRRGLPGAPDSAADDESHDGRLEGVQSS